MQLLDPTYIRSIVDYSFGDLSGLNVVPDCYAKDANINNAEFIKKYREVLASGRNTMTLFIDNIRLYKRDNVKYTAQEQSIPELQKEKDARLKEIYKDNDLLQLCSILADMNFIIFTAWEDTPIDDAIFKLIPRNVVAIHACNCMAFGGVVHPFPYGLQRKMREDDNRLSIIHSMIDSDVKPSKLLYVNHTEHKGVSARENINDLFKNKPFASVESNRIGYEEYYKRIKQHRFMLCPSGNAIGCECHRDWEVLYMRRVPIVIRSKYYEEIFKGLPVLFVRSWSDVTEELLIENNHLYEQALQMDMSKLDLRVRLDKILKPYNIDLDAVKIKGRFQSTVNLIRVLCEIRIKECVSPYIPLTSAIYPIDKNMFGQLFDTGRISFEDSEFAFPSEKDAEDYMNSNLFPFLKAFSPKFVIEKTYTT